MLCPVPLSLRIFSFYLVPLEGEERGGDATIEVLSIVNEFSLQEGML